MSQVSVQSRRSAVTLGAANPLSHMVELGSSQTSDEQLGDVAPQGFDGRIG